MISQWLGKAGETRQPREPMDGGDASSPLQSMRSMRLRQECVKIAPDKIPLASRASIAFLALAILMLWAISPVHGALERTSIEMDAIESDDIIVRFEKPLLNTAKEIVRLSPSVRGELADLLQWEFRFRPEVILIRDDSDLPDHRPKRDGRCLCRSRKAAYRR